MFASASSSSTELFYSRRLLQQTTLSQLQATATPPASENSHGPGNNSFDANVVIVLSMLLCALICALVLNSIIKIALWCSSSLISGPDNSPSARLANTGINKKVLKNFPVVNYSAEMKIPGLDPECAICLSEFAPGECIRVLPKCSHGFHVPCIDRWLDSHSTCPTCRHCLIEISDSPNESVVRIAPLEPEGLMCNYLT